MRSSTSWPRSGRASPGAGSLERFDYWLKTFEYMRETAHFLLPVGRIQ